MTSPAVERFWAAYLGCGGDELAHPGVVIAAHPHDYHGLYLLRRGETCVVSAPPGWVSRLQKLTRGCSPAQVFQPSWLASALSSELDRVIGPAYLGYRDTGAPLPPPSRGIRRLGSEDRELLEALHSACPGTEWDHSGVELDHPDLFGLERAGELVAIGLLEPWGEELLHLGLLTHPKHRGHGYARRMATALCWEAARRGKVPQYRALHSNAASLAVARALGFRNWGDMLAVRLRVPGLHIANS